LVSSARLAPAGQTVLMVQVADGSSLAEGGKLSAKAGEEFALIFQ
jgi:hypothetical protein